jgi:hypothetical protein
MISPLMGSGDVLDGLSKPDLSHDFIQDGRIKVNYQEGDRYGIILQNASLTLLFPYIFLFDTTTFSVVSYYQPLSDEALLKPGGKLQLGGSTEYLEAITFGLSPGQTQDTSYMKVNFSYCHCFH